jgi:hypothetical protein
MTTESGGSEGRRWLVEPPASGEITFQMSMGDQAEVTPEVQAAFEQLVQALRGNDVQGFVYDPKCTTKNVTCSPNYACTVESQQPHCVADYHCQIGKFI